LKTTDANAALQNPSSSAASTTGSPPASSSPRTKFWIAVALVGLTFVTYSPVFDAGFIDLDDIPYVVENQHVQGGLSLANARWALTAFDCANWHPLTWLSLQLDRSMYGRLSPGGFHFSSLVLHLLNVVLLFYLFCRMNGAVWASALTAALFALHPLHVESVAWVAERKDVLSTLFWLLTMLTYCTYVERPTWLRYALVGVCLALGLMAKPMLVTLPFVLLLMDYWPLGRLTSGGAAGKEPHRAKGMGPLVWEKLPFFALAALSCIITIQAQAAGDAIISLKQFPWYLRLLNASRSYGYYLVMTVWPFDLAIWYPQATARVVLIQGLNAAACLVIITALVLWARRRPYLAVGWFWFLGTLAPVIGIVQVGTQAMADRYTYIPLIGIFFAVAWSAKDLVGSLQWRWLKVGVPIGVGAVLAGSVYLTFLQVCLWYDATAIWMHDLQCTTDNYRAHEMMGLIFRKSGFHQMALMHLSRAVELNPESPYCRYSLGMTQFSLGNAAEAREQLLAASRQLPKRAELHYDLALACVLLPTPNLEEARQEAERAVELTPDRVEYVVLLAYVERKLGHSEQAKAAYQTALRQGPDLPVACNSAAKRLLASPAARHWEALNAELFAQQACWATEDKNSDYLQTLAKAEATLGRREEAAGNLRKAIALLSAEGKTEAAKPLEQQLKEYEAVKQ
jgi:tetratricopeptide (TPR) repeat protein